MVFFWQNPTLRSNQRCPRGMEVQTLLMPTYEFTVSQAKSWAKSHDMRYGEIDTTAHYHRLRQREPEAFLADTFRTIHFGESDIKAVVACPKLDRNQKRGRR